MSELIHMSAEEVSGLLTEIDRLLHQWDDDLSLLHTLGSALHQIWEAPAAADYIYEVHRILHGMEGEVEKLQYNHRLAQKEYEQWMAADDSLNGSRLFVLGAGDGNAVDPNDLAQGNLGDCYLIASMAAIARQKPDFFKHVIRSNADGSYTVTFYQKGKPVEVTVLPEDFQGLSKKPLDKGELWPLIYEKAYAKLHGGYKKIGKGGNPALTLEEMTGVPSQQYSPRDLSIQELASMQEKGDAIVVGTYHDIGQTKKFGDLWPFDITDRHPLYLNHDIVPNHAYYVSRVDVKHGIVYVRNPWGWDEGEVPIPYEDFKKVIAEVDVNSLKK